ncbi:hypothetical protein L6E12_06485 [Actinokineospora sp. PR83]|uniref:hypothetical protein n=1 Tax=Actinokineospora sp. PR83 TaxID=2884908 RepID=UPI001F17D442|nr:hypothetical protein [Actinokineospora sp. PR83]MCG8915432.1 hypothetical protein [Actinokineospora sp. PR83]
MSARAGWRVPRRWLVALGVAAVVALSWVDLLLLFSPARSAVAALDRDVVWVEPGVVGVDADGVRRAIGERPLTMVVVAAGSPLAADESEGCTAVTDTIDGIVNVLVVDGRFEHGCESDDLPLTTDRFGWDFATWTAYDNTTQFLRHDHRAMAEQLAAMYDNDLARGELLREVRAFHFPAYRYLLAVGLVGAVVVGVHGGSGLLERGLAHLDDRRRERAAWRERRADLGAELALVAMRMVHLPPAPELGALSRDYLRALSDWEAARPGTSLSEVEARVRGLRERVH